MTERLSAQVVVVGAGPAGIAAAITAAEAGADTLLLDENLAAGGQIWRPGVKGTPAPARRWIARLQGSGARIESAASVFVVRDERTLLVERNGEPLAVSWDRLVLATGARELFLPFPGWTLPNVMGIGGAQAMIKSGAQVSGMRVVVAGSGPLMLPVAATLAKAGAKLEIDAEQAPCTQGIGARWGRGGLHEDGRVGERARSQVVRGVDFPRLRQVPAQQLGPGLVVVDQETSGQAASRFAISVCHASTSAPDSRQVLLDYRHIVV